MTAKAKPKAKQKNPSVYSSESLMIRMILGILLLALGVVMVLSVSVGMEGSLFSNVKTICLGLAGSLAMLLPILPIWGGMLLIISARKAPPLKAYILAAFFYLGLLAVINLFSSSWDAVTRENYPYMNYIRLVAERDRYSVTPDSLGVFWKEAYQTSASRGMSGGALGMLLAWPLWSLVGVFPSIAVLIVALVVLALFLTNVNLKDIFGRMNARRTEKQALREQQWAYEQQMAMAYQQAEMPYQQQIAPVEPTARPGRKSKKAPEPAPYVQPMNQQPMAWPEAAYPVEPVPAPRPPRRANQKPQMIDVVDMRSNDNNLLPWEMPGANKRERPAAKKAAGKKPVVEPASYVEEAVQPVFYDEPVVPAAEPESTPPVSARRPLKSPRIEEPRMSGTRIDQSELILPPKKEKPGQQLHMDLPPPYAMPPLNILKPGSPLQRESREEDQLRAKRLEETLESFKIPSRVRNITHGPAIARYELEIAAGINVSRVSQVDRNIAMNMEVKSVRIEAPIPGKALVGVEVPNRVVSPVMLREVLESEEMHNHPSPLAVALGKDIAGDPIICDIAAMPHILIAGATGAGKSVCINAIINSILFRTTPEQVRMILIDPKVVELQCYNCVPHLLIPVISDPHKAAGALAWVVSEMMERYNKIKERAVRDINGYNASLPPDMEPMPRIVVIIDELADLMMQCKKEVEEYICRIAQLARAAGIHLVVATQRPSVDVITGLIKSNIPSRIAFTVSSSIDSRTILDRVGAEKLLGKGDMLYFPKGEGTPVRVQGCFLSDAEVNRVMDFMQHHNHAAEFDPDILETLEGDNGSMPVAADDVRTSESGGDEFTGLLMQAIEMAVNDRQTSISMLQRRLRIGYARAGRVIDEMAKRGIIGQADGAKPRQVLISREEFEQMKADSL